MIIKWIGPKGKMKREFILLPLILSSLIGIIVCSLLYNSDYRYFKYECSNVTITDLKVVCYNYHCEYINKDQKMLFRHRCCQDTSLNCRGLHQNVKEVEIYIEDYITEFKLIFGLCVSILVFLFTVIFLFFLLNRHHQQVLDSETRALLINNEY